MTEPAIRPQPIESFDLTDLRVSSPRVPKSATVGQSTRKASRLTSRTKLPSLEPVVPATCPFAILVDSREQLPYTFTGLDVIVPTAIAGLPTGDYSIQDHESEIAIERKSLADLYGSMTWGRERFEREVERLSELPGFAAVIIEATWPQIADPLSFDPAWKNKTKPKTIVNTITAWAIRYPRVQWWPVGSRRDCEVTTFRLLSRFWSE
jgi:ERCC4-type nuclease